MCNQCLRYDHITTDCKGKKRCTNCGEDHDSEHCQNETKCVNCKGSHIATDKNCPTRAKQNIIKTLMASKNLTYFEAQQEIKIPVSNGYSILANAEEFTSIKESYLEAVKRDRNQKFQWNSSNNGATRKKTERDKQNHSSKLKEAEGLAEIQQQGQNDKKENKQELGKAPTRKRRAEAEEGPETITMQQHLELRQKWNTKMNELASQRESYKQTTQYIFTELVKALSQNDETGYCRLIESLKSMAIAQGYIQQANSEAATNEEHIQNFTE